jgi:hypothetical protein
MHSEDTILAEASCLKKHQFEFQNAANGASIRGGGGGGDGAKTEVNASAGPIAGQTAVETRNAPGDVEKGVLEQNLRGSDSSSVTYREKDDFPEGGLKG